MVPVPLSPINHPKCGLEFVLAWSPRENSFPTLPGKRRLSGYLLGRQFWCKLTFLRCPSWEDLMWNPKFLAAETQAQLPALCRDKRVWMSSQQMGLQGAFSLSPGRWAWEGVEWVTEEGEGSTLQWENQQKRHFLSFSWRGPVSPVFQPILPPFIERRLSSQVFYPRMLSMFPCPCHKKVSPTLQHNRQQAALRSTQLAGFCCFLLSFKNCFVFLLLLHS